MSFYSLIEDTNPIMKPKQGLRAFDNNPMFALLRVICVIH